ncbi:AraC family transcriptional regulator [Aliikangiella coralliicola]|uniref:AraC family transcriptional regulator n=1 Tax=Aliikangiella coralliicola TaxID=2592383 RepID=A0A545U4G2_9GAMM|nr:AraC family transcriptional regulator [Aliikangiella coralliicola]TQV84370.1 AraC family transcriptional regulator [Aliikangiella coralliicola]
MTYQTNDNNHFTASDIMNEIGVQQIVSMFNLLSDVLFWIKDAESRIVFGNRYFLEHVGVSSLEQVIGCDDFDFSPPHIARQFIVDDQKVMSGKWVNDRLEMNLSKSGDIAWFVTSKRPLFDSQQNIIGSYGISRHLEKSSLVLSGMEAIKVPVNYIRRNYMHDIRLKQLAEISHLSISALERRFKKHLGKTPKQFINEIRLENARRILVETTLPISVIANDVGFSDHSYFSRQFSKQFGALPSAFRESCQ